MNTHGTKCSINTIKKWIGYLEEAYIIEPINNILLEQKQNWNILQKFIIVMFR